MADQARRDWLADLAFALNIAVAIVAIVAIVALAVIAGG